MIPRPEDPEKARQLLMLFAVIFGLVIVGIAATVIFNSLNAGLVIIGGGSALVGALFGMKLARELNPEASPARLALTRVLMVLIVVGVIAYLSTR